MPGLPFETTELSVKHRKILRPLLIFRFACNQCSHDFPGFAQFTQCLVRVSKLQMRQCKFGMTQCQITLPHAVAAISLYQPLANRDAVLVGLERLIKPTLGCQGVTDFVARYR